MANKIITLTHEQAVELETYLQMTAGYRKQEREEWDRLAAETKPDGSPKYPKAAGNARFWADTDAQIGEICRIIDAAPLLDASAGKKETK